MTAVPKSPSNHHDQALFLSLKKYQDKQAFLSAYDLYFDQIFRFLFFKIGNREEAQDLTSATFLKCWGYVQEGKLKSESEYKTLRSFLYKIARNLAIDYYRQSRPQTGLDEAAELSSDLIDIVAQTDQDLDLTFVISKLKELKSEYRNVLVLKYINNLSVAEIAVIQDKTKGNVRITIYRALEALKKLTQDHDREGSLKTTE